MMALQDQVYILKKMSEICRYGNIHTAIEVVRRLHY
jgi:hypothetical protein